MIFAFIALTQAGHHGRCLRGGCRRKKTGPIEPFPRHRAAIDRHVAEVEPAPLCQISNNLIGAWTHMSVGMQSHAHERSNSRIKSSRIRFTFKNSVQNPLCGAFPVGGTPGERSQQSCRPAPPVRSCRGPPSPEQFGCGIARGSGNEASLGQPGLVLAHRNTEVNEYGAAG